MLIPPGRDIPPGKRIPLDIPGIATPENPAGVRKSAPGACAYEIVHRSIQRRLTAREP